MASMDQFYRLPYDELCGKLRIYAHTLLPLPRIALKKLLIAASTKSPIDAELYKNRVWWKEK